MPLGDSNFKPHLKFNSGGDLMVGGPFTWTGIPGPKNRGLLTVGEALKTPAPDGTPLPGTPLADVLIRYLLIQGDGAGRRTHAGVATIKPGAANWSTTISKADFRKSGLTTGEARGVGMAVSLNYTAATPAFETLTWCVRTIIG